MAGQCVRWLRDNMKFFGEASEIGIIVIIIVIIVVVVVV